MKPELNTFSMAARMSWPWPSAEAFFQKAIGSLTAVALSIGGSSFSSSTGSIVVDIAALRRNHDALQRVPDLIRQPVEIVDHFRSSWRRRLSARRRAASALSDFGASLSGFGAGAASGFAASLAAIVCGLSTSLAGEISWPLWTAAREASSPD